MYNHDLLYNHENYYRICFHVRRYTEYAGCGVTAGIPMKFGTEHGISRPEVGSAKCIDAYGGKVHFPFSLIFGTSD